MPSINLQHIIIMLGVACMIIGFISVFFLQVTHGAIDLNGSHTSDIFYLNGGKSYSIAAEGSNQPFGSGGGEFVLYSSNGVVILRSYIEFSFDGDADWITVYVGGFKVQTSGNYYFQYIEDYNTVYSPARITIQESLVESLIGVDSFDLMIFGFIFIFGGAFLPDLGGWIKDRVSKGTKKEEESREIEEPPYSEDEFEMISEFEEVTCPTCGHITDGIYCEQCGTQLKDNF